VAALKDFIFLSYARADEGRLHIIVDNLDIAGFAVFVDRQMPVGRQWEVMLDERIAAAHCLLVVWSAASVASGQVAREVELAHRLGKTVVPVRIDKVVPPERFADQNVGDLHGWHGHDRDPEWAKVVALVEEIGVPRKSSLWRAARREWNAGRPTRGQGADAANFAKERTAVVRALSHGHFQSQAASLLATGFRSVHEEDGLLIVQKERAYSRRFHILLYCLGGVPGIVYAVLHRRLPMKETVKVILIEGGP
jgi:hypothetical protein